MSNLSDLLPAGASAKSITATDSGSGIAINTPVILETAGTVTQAGESVTAEAIPAGSEDTTSSSYADYCGVAVDPTSGNAVACFRDVDNSNYGTAVVGVVSGTTLTWGTPVVFESSALRPTPNQVVFDPNTAGSFVIVFQLNSEYIPRVIANTLSGSTLGSFGTSVAFQSTYGANGYCANNQLSFDPNTAGKFALTNVLTDPVPGDSGVVIGTVSGTTVAFAGSAENWDTSDDYPYSNVVWNPNVANEIVVSYIKVGWWAKVVKGTVSGTSVSWGTPSTVNSGHSDYFNLDFDPNTANSFAWAFFNGGTGLGASGAGTLVGATWTFGSNQTVPTGGSGTTFTIEFDPNQAGKLAVINRGSNGVDYVASCTPGSVSGTTLTWGSANELTANGDIQGGQQPVSLSFSATDTGKFVSVYALGSASSYELGGVVCQLEATTSNLTATNFLGIADEAISASASGVIVVQGGTKTSANTILPQTTSLGSESVFESATTNYVSAIFDSDSNRAVVAYQDNGNSNYGTAVVGTVSGTAISYGTPVVFEAAHTEWTSATFDSDSNKVVIAYKDAANSGYGTAIVGTVSGTSISYGTAVVFESADTREISATFDSDSNKVVIAYSDWGNSDYGTGIVGTVSGTSISFGTAVVFESATVAYTSATFDSNSNKVVIAYTDSGNSHYGTSIVGTVSGTAISFGTAVVFNAGESTYVSSTYDSTAQKVVISYMDGGSAPSNQGTAIVGTVSGTSISFGTEVIFNAASSNYMGMTYDANANQVVIGYQETSKGYVVLGTVSGTTVSFGTPVVFNNIDTAYISPVYNSTDNKIVITYRDTGNSNYGTGIVGTIGDGTFTIGSNYYVQADGSYDTSAGTPSVKAGLAISTTSLLLSGDS